MYLFTRTARLGPGNQAAAANWAMMVTEKVHQITDLDVSLWVPVFSPGVTTLTWVTAVEELGQLETADAKLTADTGFQMLVDEGTRFMLPGTTIDDALAQFVTPVTAPAPDAPRTNYAVVVTATLAPGGMAKGVEVGLKIAEQAKKTTGLDEAFLVGITGSYGQVQWIGDCETVEQMQAALEAIAADTKLITIIDNEGSKVFRPDAEQICYRRVA